MTTTRRASPAQIADENVDDRNVRDSSSASMKPKTHVSVVVQSRVRFVSARVAVISPAC